MIKNLGIGEWLQQDGSVILDVRSPSEYERGHIPGALSLPLLDDEERAEVGTTYKQTGKEEAYSQALNIAGPKIKDLVDRARQLAPAASINIHCWRGGMRSGSLAWLLHASGFKEINVLQRGYKGYRQWVLSRLDLTCPMVVLGGWTGSAKTEVLKHLVPLNEPVIDLEKLAHHKGSAFGWIGEAPQPTQEQFENDLAGELNQHLERSAIWVEDESEHIGKVRIPRPLFLQIRKAPVFFIDIPKSVRVPHLVHTYARYGDEKLEQSILKIAKRLGGLNTKLALEALQRQDYELVADLALTYYDKTYDKGIGNRDPASIIRIPSETIDPAHNAGLVLEYKLNHIHGISQTYAV